MANRKLKVNAMILISCSNVFQMIKTLLCSRTLVRGHSQLSVCSLLTSVTTESDEEPPAFRLAGEEGAELRKRLHKPMKKSGGSIKAGKRGPKKPLKKIL